MNGSSRQHVILYVCIYVCMNCDVVVLYTDDLRSEVLMFSSIIMFIYFQAHHEIYICCLASDDCDTIGKTFVQLKLEFLRSNGDEKGDSGSSNTSVCRGGRQQVFMEMNLDQFYQFLASIEKCKSCIDLFNPST